MLTTALSRVTRDGDASVYRAVPAGDVDGDGVVDVAAVGPEVVRMFTELGQFTLRTQDDAWATIVAEPGSVFADVVNLGDPTDDGRTDLALTQTWSAPDATAWVGLVPSDTLSWRTGLRASEMPLVALSTRAAGEVGWRAALVQRADGPTLALGAPSADAGATGAGAVLFLGLPN